MKQEDLRRRIERLLAAAQLQRGPEPTTWLSFHVHLFTEQEQGELQLFLDLVEPKIPIENGHPNLQALTDSELDALRLWLLLEQALLQEDIDAAAKYRRYRSLGLEQLIQRFLAINEESIPASFDQAPKVDGKTYYRTWFRADRARIERAIAGGRLRRSDRETLRSWCDLFAFPAA